MSKSSRFVEGFVVGLAVAAAAAWFYCCDHDRKRCQADDEEGGATSRTKDLINQTREAIDKGFDKLSKMAESRHASDSGKQGS